MRRFFASLPLLIALAYAQPTPQEITAALIAVQETAQDYQVRIAGVAQISGQSLSLDVTLQRINALELSRIDFTKPEILAGNAVISEKDQIKNYLALTNQVVVTKGNSSTSRVNLSLLTDIRNVLSPERADIALLGSETIEGQGTAYRLEVKPKPGSRLQFVRAVVWVLEQPWRPYRLQTLDASGKPLNDLLFVQYQTNLGLTPQKLRALPLDAEVVNK